MSGRVVAAGAVAVEEVLVTEHFPGERGVSFARRIEARLGGTAALASMAAAEVGAATRCVGTVGTDPAGAALRRHLARADVDVTTVLPVLGPTSRILREAPGLAAQDTLADMAALLGGRDVAGRDVAGVDVAGRDVAGADVAGVDVAGADVAGPEYDRLCMVPGSAWGCGAVGVEHALERCEPGDALLLDWSALDDTGALVRAAYDLDLQILALLSPYPLLPQELDLRAVDVVITDRRGAAWLADAGELPASLCVLVGRHGLSWDGEIVLAHAASEPGPQAAVGVGAPEPLAWPALAGSAYRTRTPLDRAYAVLAGALAGHLACGDDRPEAAQGALAALARMEAHGDPWRGMGPPPGASGPTGRVPWRQLRLDTEELG